MIASYTLDSKEVEQAILDFMYKNPMFKDRYLIVKSQPAQVEVIDTDLIQLGGKNGEG